MNTENPLVTIVVPSYNNSKYLPDLITSVLQQTYKNWELIIVDDCSTDGVKEFVKPFLNNPGISLIIHNKNTGVSGTCKTGTDLAKGEIIALIGADDGIPTDALKKIVDVYVKNPNVSTVYTRAYSCNQEDFSIIREFEYSKGPLKTKSLLFEELGNYNFQTFSKKHYDLTQGFDLFFTKAMDQDIFLKLEEVGEVKCINEPLYYYRINSNGISQFTNANKAELYCYYAVKNAYNRRKKNGFVNISQFQYRKRMGELYYYKALVEFSDTTSSYVKRKMNCLFFLFVSWMNFPLFSFSKSRWRLAIK